MNTAMEAILQTNHVTGAINFVLTKGLGKPIIDLYVGRDMLMRNTSSGDLFTHIVVSIVDAVGAQTRLGLLASVIALWSLALIMAWPLGLS